MNYLTDFNWLKFIHNYWAPILYTALYFVVFLALRKKETDGFWRKIGFIILAGISGLCFLVKGVSQKAVLGYAPTETVANILFFISLGSILCLCLPDSRDNG